MKILELRFKNLNSLYGEWIIDFTNPEYVSNGIFALAGPTGAGKSTILDALCLALYGATPRLGKITKSGNEIMSRQTGECYAEVLFESQAGRFRCHWEQRRARKSANGKLQDQEHQIVDEDTGKPLETKKSLVAGVIEEKTGMDFDRFTRSILLAQGGFDTFLKADAEQKSKILEQITGTEIYSEISRRVHERQRDEGERLNLLQAEISGIVIRELEEEKEIALTLEKQQKEEAELSNKCAEIGKDITWLTDVNKLKKEIDSLAEKAAKIQRDSEIFKPERDRLERAVKAASLDGMYATLTAVRRQQADDQASLKAEEATLPQHESHAKKHAEFLKSAEQETMNAKVNVKAAAPLIQKIRSLDQKLIEQQKRVCEEEERCKQDAIKIDEYKKLRLTEQNKRSDAEKNRERADSYLREHEHDEWLVSGFAGVEEQLGTLLSKQKEIVQKEAELKKSEIVLKDVVLKELERYQKQYATRKQELEGALNNLQHSKDLLNTLLGDRQLREYRAEKESLLREMVFLSKIAELEAYREKLEDGTPCPLCGAKKHPFAEGNLPASDEVEKKIESLATLIGRAEDLEVSNKTLEEAEALCRRNLTDSEKKEAAAANDKKAAEKDIEELKNDLKKLRLGFTELKQAVFSRLQPLGMTDIPDDDLSSLLNALKTRLNAWQVQVMRRSEVEKQIAAIESEIKRLEVIVEIQSTALAEKQQSLEILKKEYAAGRDERKELYGDRKTDDEELRLNRSVVDAEEAEKKVRALNNEMQQKLTSAITHVEALKKYIEQRGGELKEIEMGFSSAFASAGFHDEKRFCEARLTTEQREALSAKAKELDTIQADLKTLQKDREAQRAVEMAKRGTDRSLEELEQQRKVYEESLKQLRDIIAGLKHTLSENAAARGRVKEKKAVIEAQKKEYHRWKRLNDLIGSADGKKYRNFAQGLTFEVMVSHANRQLDKMTDRYLLMRNDDQPLELNVIDSHQAGEIRSTRNLSGGESFIVSLALALGLSKMASHKVRVDSLFLDEGFGTLDEDVLESALDTLSALQQDGKLIGVISHVPALKERIPTQIIITPVASGRSALSGPGCKKVS